VDEEKIEASMEKGLLKLTLPKKEPVVKEKKKVEIK